MAELTVPAKPRRSRGIVVLAVVSAVAIICAGFWLATRFQSPAQQEANATAPAAGPVFAHVTQGSLEAEVSFTGRVGPSTQIPVTVLPAADASLAVVTGRPLGVGTTVSSGQVLTEVNGRPLFGVESPFSFYRDMGIGDRGPDVEALQHALVARSYAVVPDGLFGGETAAAIERWYTDSGYESPVRTGTAPKNPSPDNENEVSVDSSTDPPAEDGYVPLTEMLAIPAESVRVVQGAQVGQRLAVEGQPDLILGSADLVVTITVPIAELGGVVAGDAAAISVDGVTVSGVVGDIRALGSSEPTEAAEESSEGASEEEGAPAGAEGVSEVTFFVAPSTALPVSSGRARVTVTEEIVARDELIVPVLAVSDRGPDKKVLTKRQGDGTLMEVPVRVLGALQGEVAVEPTDQGALEVGDQVRVG